MDTLKKNRLKLWIKKNEDQEDKCIEQIAKYSAMLMDKNVLLSMSPDSKNAYCSALKRKRKSVIEQMEKIKDDNNDDE